MLNRILFLMWVIMAGGMSGIGLSIMHDANHGSYSKNKTVNQVLSYLINFVGGNVANWRIQHNVLHHTFTNIEGADQDMDGPFFLRFVVVVVRPAVPAVADAATSCFSWVVNDLS